MTHFLIYNFDYYRNNAGRSQYKTFNIEDVEDNQVWFLNEDKTTTLKSGVQVINLFIKHSVTQIGSYCYVCHQRDFCLLTLCQHQINRCCVILKTATYVVIQNFCSFGSDQPKIAHHWLFTEGDGVRRTLTAAAGPMSPISPCETHLMHFWQVKLRTVSPVSHNTNSVSKKKKKRKS